jgi:hypothetical protein
MTENTLLNKKHILLCIDEQIPKLSTELDLELQYIKKNFCGLILSNVNELQLLDDKDDTLIYFCGNVEENSSIINNNNVYIIHDFCTNLKMYDLNKVINSGKVPINIHGVGVFFRNYFGSNKFGSNNDYFKSIEKEHDFQSLTESNKPSNAFRKGIYLSKVENKDDGIHFNLLRCSSNLSGPTDNLRDTDDEIIKQANKMNHLFFDQKVDLNHVLAQIYYNTKLSVLFVWCMRVMNFIWNLLFGIEYYNVNNTIRKAKISVHSDKTKDMPRNGTMAFCTFYKSFSENIFHDERLNDLKKIKNDLFDYQYANLSVFTKIYFRNKQNPKDVFNVILYPNSLLLIPLSTNRLYTHEIRPSPVSIDKLPTRMGYVIRCSKTEAVYKNNQTYINDVKLREITENNIEDIRGLYFKENTTDEIIEYGDIFYSMNSGDYKCPIL